jgi:putative DNA primase/helicase
MSTELQINDEAENLNHEAPASKSWVNAVLPWPEPVEGHVLLDNLAQTLKRFVLLPRWAPEALALWVLHTYAFELRDVTAYLGIESPEKRCGKTTLLGVLNELVNRPIAAANISSPAFFRVIEEARPTLLIDEADTLLAGNDELRGILNSGYTRSTAYVVRVGFQDRVSSNGGLARFSCWCPKVMAAIGRLPETLEDRCIVVRMQRKLPHEPCERLREMDRSKAAILRQQCARFVADHAEAIAQLRPQMPACLNDRAADLWEPLLVLADLAQQAWPETGRSAAEALTKEAREDCPIGSLFMDLFLAFVVRKDRRLFSRTIVAALNQRAGRPWMQMRKGKEIDELWLARQLAPYGIRPHTLRIEGVAAKGYTEADFVEVFRRYIPPSEIDELKLGMRQTEEGQ